jgi:hypothetical protein
LAWGCSASRPSSGCSRELAGRERPTGTATSWPAGDAPASWSEIRRHAEIPALSEALDLLAELVPQEGRRRGVQALAALAW